MRIGNWNAAIARITVGVIGVPAILAAFTAVVAASVFAPSLVFTPRAVVVLLLSPGYVAYRDGALSAFDLVGWMGSSRRYRSSNAEEVDTQRVLSRGAENVLASSILTVEDLFQRFYEEPDISSVYVVAEGGHLLDPPRSEP